MADLEALAGRVVGRMHELLHSEATNDTMAQVHELLAYVGVPKPYPDAERLAIALATGLFTLLAYFVLFGKRHRRRRQVLQEELHAAYGKVQELQDKLAEMEDEDGNEPREQVRIWMDGAFDMMHYGHMNAFRQARALGTFLVVGVNDDESITACKGAPPVLNNEERIASVDGCKFVDVVEPHCPYIMNEEYLQRMIKKHRIDYVVHGDDPCIVDGKDVYESAQKLGKYRTIPRTEGVSTSDILGRMLVMHKTHHTHEDFGNGQLSSQVVSRGAGHSKMYERPSKFLTTNRMLRLFSVGNHEPRKDDRVVYIDGAFDMFHAGHVEILKRAKQEGSYLIVGVHNDAVVNSHRGLNYPIMNLHERVLSVLGCKYVDDVLIDAPWQVTKEMIASLHLSVVVHGSHRDADHLRGFSLEGHYKHARDAGVFKVLQSPSALDVKDIVARINNNRERFEKKFESKMKSEEEYYADRYSKALPK
jgi:ethanolamine-phosphate cytidylyltransferase